MAGAAVARAGRSRPAPDGTGARGARSTAEGERPDRRALPRGHRRRSRLTAFAFVAPLVCHLAAFYVYPLYRNLDLSLRDYTVRSFVTGDAPFIGRRNFQRVLDDPAFGPALRHTVVFTFVSLVFQYVIGLGLAVFFNRSFRLSVVLRALFLVPWLLPLIVSASTWSWMFNSAALDTQGAGTAQGTSVVQAPSGSGSTQTWTLTPAGSGLYKIANRASGLLLGIKDMVTTDGGTALIWGDNGTADHLWQLIPSGDGYYKIANYNSGLLLGVDGMSTSSGAQVLQWDDNGTADHLWKLTSR